MMSLSKEKLEFYTNKIPFERCLDYGLEKVSKATSIDLIKGIIGGPNMKYKCIELEQSFFVYHVMRDNLIEVCEKTNCKILFMEAHNFSNFDGLLTVTLKPKSAKSREHIVLWGCIRFTLDTIPAVGFARAFDITGELIVCLHSKVYMSS